MWHYYPIFDGRYVYFTPGIDNTRIARFDTELEWRYKDRGFNFNDATCWSEVPAAYLSSKSNEKTSNLGTWGGTFDGQYVYFSPTSRRSTHLADTTTFARIYTTKDWSNQNNWKYMDFEHISGWDFGSQPKNFLFVNATFDGRFVYYVPRNSRQFVRFDTKKSFNDPTSWSLMNLVKVTDEVLHAFNGAVFDGKFVNFVPHHSNELIRVKAFPSCGMFSRWRE